MAPDWLIGLTVYIFICGGDTRVEVRGWGGGCLNEALWLESLSWHHKTCWMLFVKGERSHGLLLFISVICNDCSICCMRGGPGESRAKLHRLIFSHAGNSVGTHTTLDLFIGLRYSNANAIHLFLFISHLERFLELPLKLRLLIFLHTEKWSGSWLHLHWDRFGEQLHSTKERTLRGLVHGLHPPWAPTERLTNTAAPTGSPFHEEATKGAAAGPPEPPPSFRFYPLPVQSKD